MTHWPPSPEQLARTVASGFARRYRPLLTDSIQRELADKIQEAIQSAVLAERNECISVCLGRYELWAPYEHRASALVDIRLDAMARANEDAYLADALRARDG